MFDRMAVTLDLWSALLLGILYLAFQAFPIIFEEVHGFEIQSTQSHLGWCSSALGSLSAAAATRPRKSVSGSSSPRSAVCNPLSSPRRPHQTY